MDEVNSAHAYSKFVKLIYIEKLKINKLYSWRWLFE